MYVRQNVNLRSALLWNSQMEQLYYYEQFSNWPVLKNGNISRVIMIDVTE